MFFIPISYQYIIILIDLLYLYRNNSCFYNFVFKVDEQMLIIEADKELLLTIKKILSYYHHLHYLFISSKTFSMRDNSCGTVFCILYTSKNFHLKIIYENLPFAIFSHRRVNLHIYLFDEFLNFQFQNKY